MDILWYFYEVCGCNIKRSGWAKHVKTKNILMELCIYEKNYVGNAGVLRHLYEENGTWDIALLNG